MIMLLGNVVWRNASVLVMYGTLSSPGIGGIEGLAPAAMTIFFPLIRSPFTSTTYLSTNFARPLKSKGFLSARTFFSMERESASTVWLALSVTCLKFTLFSDAVNPNSEARWMVSATSAECITILEGMQPRFRQVPPMAPSSTIATFNPSSAAPAATFNPAPEPITIRSNVFMICVFQNLLVNIVHQTERYI